METRRTPDADEMGKQGHFKDSALCSNRSSAGNVIEEFFKALKTGCRLEERQMESAEALLCVVSLLVPAA